MSIIFCNYRLRLVAPLSNENKGRKRAIAKEGTKTFGSTIFQEQEIEIHCQSECGRQHLWYRSILILSYSVYSFCFMHTLIPVPGNVEDLFGDFIVLLKLHKFNKNLLSMITFTMVHFFHPDQEEASLNSKPDFFIKVIIFA